MDTALFRILNQSLSNPVFDGFMPWFTDAWFWVALAFFIPVSRKDPGRALATLALALLAVGLADATGQALKLWAGRPRPCEALPDVRLLVGCGPSGSMPSNHAATAFAALSVVARRKPGRMGWVFWTIATLVAFSRIVVGVHYPSDVVAGALLGVTIGFFATGLSPWLDRQRAEHPERTALFLSLLVLSVFRLVYIAKGPYGLSGDEAHYWEWSRRLDWSYYSKGPLVAWCIRALTGLLGHTELAIRSGAVFFSAATSVVLYRLAVDLSGRERAGLYAALLPQIVPIFAVYGIVFTIDPPFLFFWTLGLLLFYRATSEGRLLTWLGLGVVIGLGMLAKYTMGLFFLGALVFLLWSAEDRRWFLRAGPWGGLAAAAFFFSPVLFWNAAHDWVSFRHTAGHVVQSGVAGLSLKDLGDFLGSQLAVISPGILLLLLGTLGRPLPAPLDRAWRMMVSFALPVLLFFATKSLQGKVQANWALEAYPALFVLLGIRLGDGRLPSGIFRRALILSVILSVGMTGVLHSPGLIHRFTNRFAILDKLVGWPELAREVDAHLEAMPRPERTFVVSDYYMVASELAFYLKERPTVYNVSLGRRMNQYQLWPGFHHRVGDDAVFVIMADSPMDARFGERFERFERETFSIRRYGTTLQVFTIFRCFGFKGMVPEEARSF